jgi:hypothetical protein
VPTGGGGRGQVAGITPSALDSRFDRTSKPSA